MDTSSDRPPLPRPAAPQPLGEVIVGWLRWFGIARLIVTMVAVVAVVGGGYWLLRSPAAPIESTLPYASASSTTIDAQTGSSAGPVPSGSGVSTTVEEAIPTAIVVYVTGAVTTPGVYTLAADARVQDAVVAAGGMSADAEADSVNLAGFLVDGARIYVPRVGVPVPSIVTPAGSGSAPGGGGAPSAPKPAGPLDLNTATAEQLDELPGVGPSTAAAIVQHRETAGPYATVDDLLDVRGIGPAKLEAIRGLITV